MIRQTIIRRLELEAGGVLESAHIAFHTSFERYDGTLPVIWLCHALTTDSDAENWWPGMVGPGKPVDTEKNFVVCVNMIGSPFGSESPASVNPATGRPWLLDFPPVTVRDSVKAMIEVRKHLGINHVDTLIGCSNGGFQATEWAVTEPDLFGRCFFIATNPRMSPYISATMANQRMAIEADPTFREAKSLQGGAAGLISARAQALLSYRCFESYRLKESEKDNDVLFARRVDSYQRYKAEKFVREGFDAYSFYTICNIVDSHNVGRGRGGVEKALQRIQAPTTVVSIDRDAIFPPEEGRRWARLIPGARFVEISSPYGHDGFILETARLSAILAE